MIKVEIILPEDRALIEQAVKSGTFASPSAVVSSAQYLLREQPGSPRVVIDALRSHVAAGVAQLDKGEHRAWGLQDCLNRMFSLHMENCGNPPC